MDSHETLLIFTDTLQRWAFSQASRRHWMRIIQHPLGLAWAFLILFFGSPVWEVCLLLRGWDYCTLLQRLLETPLLIEDQERCIFRAEIVGSQRKKNGLRYAGHQHHQLLGGFKTELMTSQLSRFLQALHHSQQMHRERHGFDQGKHTS